MADCECLPTCIFFNDKMKNKPASAEQFKRNYCRGDNKDCARFQVFQALGKENVPTDLFPNQPDRAKKIIG